MKVLHLDTNHPLLLEQLKALGFENHQAYTASKEEVLSKIHHYDGIVIRSRFSIDKPFLDQASNLKFIGRVGAGLENIDVDYAASKGVKLLSAPEGNRNAVGEHALGMLLSLFNKLNSADKEVRSGVWLREENRGHELEGKTVGIIGYGNMGKAFARKLKGFDVRVVFYDIRSGLADENAEEVSLAYLQKSANVLSLHVPETPETIGMVNAAFIEAFENPFWLINTARGKCVATKDLVHALASGKILGAGLDVLEFEKSSFESLFDGAIPDEFSYLLSANNVLLTPHVAGWTQESKAKLAQTIVDKIKANFC